MQPQLTSLSCFFPAFNEDANVGPLLEEALETLPRFARRWEALVVDDGSTDCTAEIVEQYASRHPEIRLVRHPRNLGYGAAVRTGLRHSTGDAVFLTDADRQFRLADIDLLLPDFDEVDLVLGYRVHRQDPPHRLVVQHTYHAALRMVLGLQVRDVDCAFKLFHRRVVDAIVDQLRSRSNFVSPEIAICAELAGFKLRQVGVPHYPRTAGRPGGASPKVVARTIGEMYRMRNRLREDARRAVPE